MEGITKSVFLREVMLELGNIKDKATPEEVARLNFKHLNHTTYQECIYGQMTGNCLSDRAKELQSKSYTQVSGFKFGEVIKFEEQSFAKGDSFTALEKYLFMCSGEERKRIIQYLQGKIDRSELKLTI